MKKIIGLIIVLCLIIPAYSGLAVQNTDKNIQMAINDAIEQEAAKIVQKHLSKYNIEYQRELNNLNKATFNELTTSEKTKLSNIKSKYIENANIEIDEVMKQFGFEKIESEDDKITILRDNSADLVITDVLYYNSDTQFYNFRGNWDFKDWDIYTDIADIAAFRMNNSSYPIYNSYAYTYDQAGNQTGYVANGSHSSGSSVTKRFENSNGVVFNVTDKWITHPSHAVYTTDNGSVSVYFKKGSGNNKAFLDFEHNYKVNVLSGSASFSGVSLDSISLRVTYSKVNKNYQRTSGGRTIN